MYKKFNNGAIFNNRNITIATENNYISEDDVPNDYWFFSQPVKGYNQEIIANFNKEPLIKE